MVAVLGETTGGPFLPRLRDQMLQEPSGRKILKERPRITSTSIDIPWLRSLPKGTFGSAYVDWLDSCKVTPDTRDPVNN
jgi:ubiquinone biosynthesis protein COQ4